MGDMGTAPVAEDVYADEGGSVVAIRRLISDAIQARRDKHYESYRKTDRAVDRNVYMRKREAQGETVRAYRSLKSEERLPGEDDLAFQARVRRERRRQAEGKSGEPRPYTDLSGLTPDQKALHKREQAAERKRKQRARKLAGEDRNLGF